MADPNVDLAVMESRMAAAVASPCASAVSSHGRREVVARSHRARCAEIAVVAGDNLFHVLRVIVAFAKSAMR